jgi:hypothetical protein
MIKRIVSGGLSVVLTLSGLIVGPLVSPSVVHATSAVSQRTTVAAGYTWTLAIDPQRVLWLHGDFPELDNLGDGSEPPRRILDDVVSVAGSGYAAFVIKSDDSLWSIGRPFGTLGVAQPSAPTKVMDGVAAVSVSRNQAVILKRDGTVWTFGNDELVNLFGDSSLPVVDEPRQVLSGAVDVAAGDNSGFAVKSDGSLWGWGRHFHPRPVPLTGSTALTPSLLMWDVRAVESDMWDTTYAIRSDHSLWVLGRYPSTELSEPFINPPTFVAADVADAKRFSNGVALLGTDGVLRHVTNEGTAVIASGVAAAESSVGALFVTLQDGRLMSQGDNRWLQLGYRTDTTATTTLRQAMTGVLLPSPSPAPPLVGPTRIGGVIPIDPARVMDTRVGDNYRTADGDLQGIGQRSSGSTISVPLAGRAGVAASASAVMLNVAAVGASGPGYATVFPCDAQRPLAASINFDINAATSNAVFSKLSPQGDVCVFVSAAVDLVIDVTTYLPAHSQAIVPLVPGRIMDTRPGRTTIDGRSQGTGIFHGPQVVAAAGRAGVVPGARAVLVNLAAVEDWPSRRGWLEGSCQQTRTTAVLTTGLTNVTSGLAVIPLSDTGDLCIYVSHQHHVVIDVVGYIPGGQDLGLELLRSARMLDTRPGYSDGTIDGLANGIGRRPAGTVTQLPIGDRHYIPRYATSVTVTVVAIRPESNGFLTVFPCGGPMPLASSLNYRADQTTSNLVVAKVGAGSSVCIFNSAATDLVADIWAYST